MNVLKFATAYDGFIILTFCVATISNTAPETNKQTKQLATNLNGSITNL